MFERIKFAKNIELTSAIYPVDPKKFIDYKAEISGINAEFINWNLNETTEISKS